MRKLDNQEKGIVKELILNPRISDNKITKNTQIPLKTVNRKRKKLEEEGLLKYFCSLNTSNSGTGEFTSRQMITITFKEGITRSKFIEKISPHFLKPIKIKHIYESHLGESSGNLVWVLTLESRLESDIIEILNAELIPELKWLLGENSIKETNTIRLHKQIGLLHNYLPEFNMKKGKLESKEIFITD